MWAYSGEKVGNVAYINLHYNDLFLQTAFLREKEENHVRVGGGGSEKKSAFKISSTHYLWASKFITNPYVYIGKPYLSGSSGVPHE